jgi:hypothetical protein
MTLAGYAGGVTPIEYAGWLVSAGPAQISHDRLALWSPMKPSAASRRFPVTVTHLPVVRCQVCQRTIAHQPGKASEVLTDHYRRSHPDKLGLPAQ